ncbi:peptidoglycan bridge formation glycyltransferase FemA/FemB family protein, partial [Candidatus Saccharibacteria bacterium]|nr:peptidoglycan bridge formation glycyltransferase FemA/FemB family protein [Candidatus Saccharibacteria bacterium]
KYENFLQSPKWEKMNELVGHQVISEKIAKDGYVLMIIKSAKRGRYMEIPGGPVINWKSDNEIAEVKELIVKTAKKHRCVFIRLRPPLLNNTGNLAILKKMGGRKSPMHLAAEHTVILDLTKTEEELLAGMRRQTRYEVRRSGKLGIKVESGNSEELFKEFHKVQKNTAARQHFVPPDLKTLLAEREAFGKDAKIYVAKTPEDEPIAYGLILIDGDEADYYEAASTDLNRKLPGAYALQWQVIKDLKKQKIKRYNLWGIAPPNQPHHRYAGVTTFKTGFGGEIVTFVPAHDIIINKLKYAPDFIIETIRKKRRHL